MGNGGGKQQRNLIALSDFTSILKSSLPLPLEVNNIHNICMYQLQMEDFLKCLLYTSLRALAICYVVTSSLHVSLSRINL